MMIKKLAVIMIAAAGLAACNEDDARVANHNITKSADNFEINRRIIFINGITDKYLLSVEGLCSLSSGSSSQSITVTCKTGPNEFKRHQMGLSNNVTYVLEQLDSIKASVYHYRVTFKPQTIVPAIDLRIGKE